MFSKIMAGLIVALAFATVIAFGLVAPAFAQDAGSTSISVTDLLAPFKPYVVELVTILVGVLVGLITRKLNELTGLKIDAAQRDALHMALTSGVMAGVHAIEQKTDGKTIDLHSAIVAEGVRYVQASVPDAIKYFGLTPEKISAMIRAKIPALTTIDA